MLQNILLKNLYRFSVRVRYAPSPTGPMHLGAVRTALFNYMFAKNNNGKFIVRIEDTDIERNVKDSEKDILQTLDWLGILPDQSPNAGGKYGPYIQSQRLNIYKQIQNQFLKKGFAYPCFCQSQPLKKQKKNSKQSEQKQNQLGGYDGKCRKLTLEQVKAKIANGQKYVIRLKSDFQQLKPKNFKDQVFGNVTAVNFDDFVLVKKNGYPTYHFANVIDDWKMDITHVIRGVQWLTNTSKHIYLYRVLGVQPPKFLHLPLIFTADGKKLSKRDPTAPVMDLRRKGYLPQAIINYTALLGFSPNIADSQNSTKQPGDKKPKQKQKQQTQYYTLKQLCQKFQIDKINNSPIRSDKKKLNYFNRYYMRKKWQEKDPHLINSMITYFRNTFNLKSQQNQHSEEFLKKFVECTIQRISCLEDFRDFQYFFREVNFNNQNSIKDIKKILGPNSQITNQSNNKLKIINSNPELLQKTQKILHNLRLIFLHVITPAQYSQQKIAQTISKYIYDNKNQLSNQDVYHVLRLAVTGKKSGVNIVKSCFVLGEGRVQRSLGRFHDMIRSYNQEERNKSGGNV